MLRRRRTQHWSVEQKAVQTTRLLCRMQRPNLRSATARTSNHNNASLYPEMNKFYSSNLITCLPTDKLEFLYQETTTRITQIHYFEMSIAIS